MSFKTTLINACCHAGAVIVEGYETDTTVFDTEVHIDLSEFEGAEAVYCLPEQDIVVDAEGMATARTDKDEELSFTFLVQRPMRQEDVL
jgi:hypothetical protein